MERPIKELLILLRDNAKVDSTWFGLKQRIDRGLCLEARKLCNEGIITRTEWMILVRYMKFHRPNGTCTDTNQFWWRVKLWKPRLHWLNKQINSL